MDQQSTVTGLPPVPTSEIDEEEPNTSQPNPSDEDRLLGRLLERLTTMGVVTSRPSQPEPQGEVSPGQGLDSQPGTQQWTRSWDQSWEEWQDRPSMSLGWSSWKDWRASDWKHEDAKFDRPYISHLEFPKFDGRREEYSNYQYAVLNLKSQCAPKDYKYLAPKLISNFTGSMSEDARAMELLGSDFQVDDGVEKLLAFLRKRLHITDLNLETEAFERYFSQLARKKGETLMKYINAEETAYRKLQRVLKTSAEEGEDEYSSEDDSKTRKFQLPKRLRGWHFLERAAIPIKEHSGILNQTGGMNIDKLKKVMSDSLPEKILRDIDGRTTS